MNPILNASGSNLPLIGAAQFAFNPKPTVSQIMAMLSNIGATVVRIEVPWADTELSSGVYAVSPYVEGFIAAARASGRSVVLLLDYGNQLYPGSGAWNMPPRDQASCDGFANYAAWLVKQYAAPDVWFEVYNEPNNPEFWANAVNPSQYAALLTACITKMRAVPVKGATAQIISAGVGPVAVFNDQNPFMHAVATAVGPATMAKLTAQTLHPYDASNTPEAIFAFIDAYRSVVPCDAPLAVTEWGYPNQWLGADENKRAIYVSRMIGCAVLAGVKLLTIYGLRDTGSDPNNIQYSFGLHKFDRTPKAAAKAAKAMMTALAGTESYDAERDGALYRITLRKAGGVVAKIVWSDGPVTSITEAMASVQSVEDTNGFRSWFRLMPGGVMVTVGPAIAPIIIVGT